MNQSELDNVLRTHVEWLRGDGGKRANLLGANLSSAILSCADLSCADLSSAILSCADLSNADLLGANLRSANLRSADLSCANLRSANLRSADLSCADLLGADLSRCTGLISPAQWVAQNLEIARDSDGNMIGWYAYKSFGDIHGPAPSQWVITPGATVTEVANPNRQDTCGCGVNVATLEWCKRECSKEIWRVLIPLRAAPSIVVPYATDGKIRCEEAQLLEVVS